MRVSGSRASNVHRNCISRETGARVRGELIQIDGCDHRWCEERAPACTLLVFIDDATSRLMTLHFNRDRVDLQLLRGHPQVS
jgi:hypothetical protein